MMTKKAFMLAAIALLVIVAPLQTVSASGVGASPGRIDYGVMGADDVLAKSLYVINTGDGIGRIVVVAETFENITEISVSEFALNPKESRLINVTMNIPSGFEEGDHSGSILIVSFPGASSGLGIGASVRIPVEFTVEGKTASLRTLGFAIIGCVCLMIILLICSRRLK